jgi:hypothetical protein
MWGVVFTACIVLSFLKQGNPYPYCMASTYPCLKTSPLTNRYNQNLPLFDILRKHRKKAWCAFMGEIYTSAVLRPSPSGALSLAPLGTTHIQRQRKHMLNVLDVRV